VFTKTKRQASKVSEELIDRGFNAAALHGDMSQEARERSMAAFRAGKKDILVATEVAARGIDVDDVTHVINYTVPEDEKAYLHRVGRTGRAGRTGIAVTFVDWEDLTRWKHINDALEFGQPDPLETYSSSKHLFDDLDIPAGTKGRLKRERTAAEKAERQGGEKPRRDGRGKAPAGKSAGNGSGEKQSGEKQSGEKHGGGEHPRPNRNRQRRRTRGGSGSGSTS
jgi:superfamily II DNA/RNA helicase